MVREASSTSRELRWDDAPAGAAGGVSQTAGDVQMARATQDRRSCSDGPDAGLPPQQPQWHLRRWQFWQRWASHNSRQQLLPDGQPRSSTHPAVSGGSRSAGAAVAAGASGVEVAADAAMRSSSSLLGAGGAPPHRHSSTSSDIAAGGPDVLLRGAAGSAAVLSRQSGGGGGVRSSGGGGSKIAASGPSMLGRSGSATAADRPGVGSSDELPSDPLLQPGMLQAVNIKVR